MGESTRYIGYHSYDGVPTKYGKQLRLIREGDKLRGEGMDAEIGKFTLSGTVTGDKYEWTANFKEAGKWKFQGELEEQEIRGKWDMTFLGKELTGDFYLRPFQRGESFELYAQELMQETNPSICSQCGAQLREGFNYCYNCGVELEFPDIAEEITPVPSIPDREKSLGRKIFELGLFFMSMDEEQDRRALVIMDRFFSESQVEINFDYQRVSRRFFEDQQAGEIEMAETLAELESELDQEQKTTIYAMALAIVSANEQVTNRDKWAVGQLYQAWEEDLDHIDWQSFEQRFGKILDDFRRAHHKE